MGGGSGSSYDMDTGISGRPARALDERGFTLIELMVVVLIIAILIAIALPTFLGARERASNRAAQSNLKNALTNARVVFVDNANYTGISTASQEAAMPELDFSQPTSISQEQIAWAIGGCAPNTCEWAGAALASTGVCWFIRDVSPPGASASTYYGSGTPCTGAAALVGATLPAW